MNSRIHPQPNILKLFYQVHKFLLFSLLILAKTASAEVSESLVYHYYTVNADGGGSLREILNKATPIREHNLPFHGYTKWNVKWNYRWFEQTDGRCKITSVTTELTGIITLPVLIDTTAEQIEIFGNYLSALRTHELGHYSIGKETATVINSGIMALPEMSSCKELESTANDLGYQILDKFKAQEKQYDISTEHGKKQGAWLEK